MENTTRRSKRLGKGLSALIPEINEEIDKKDIVQIKLSNIRPNKNQPRKEFDEDRIKALSDSIKNVSNSALALTVRSRMPMALICSMTMLTT